MDLQRLPLTLGDPSLGTVEAASTEEAVRKAGRDPAITRKALPCAGL